MGEIVRFPKQNIRLENNESNYKERADDLKKEYAETLIALYAENFINQLSLEGFDIDSPALQKDFAFAIESLKSCVYRQMGIEHTIQNLVDQHFEYDEPADNLDKPSDT